MKRPILIVAIIILTAGFCYFVYDMAGFVKGFRPNAGKNLQSQQANTGTYFVEPPAGFNTTEFKATITLDPGKKIHKMKFPNGGTETNVSIYDSTYLKAIQNNTLPKTKPLTKGNFSRGQEVSLDITLLQHGHYYVQYFSDDLNGIFPLTIK
jgi:hypothetical protein